jgi:hypothetical protein
LVETSGRFKGLNYQLDATSLGVVSLGIMTTSITTLSIIDTQYLGSFMLSVMFLPFS